MEIGYYTLGPAWLTLSHKYFAPLGYIETIYYSCLGAKTRLEISLLSMLYFCVLQEVCRKITHTIVLAAVMRVHMAK